MDPLFLPRLPDGVGDPLEALVTFQGRGFKGRPAVAARFGACRLAQLQGDGEVFRDRFAAFFDFLLVAHEVALKLAECLLGLSDLRGPESSRRRPWAWLRS